MKYLGVVFLLLIVACSSSDPVSDPATSTQPIVTTTLVPVTTPGGSGPSGSTCTAADLTGPALPMPTPKIVKDRVVIERRYNAHILESPGETPRLNAEQAWQKLLEINPMRARSGELLFGTFRASVPFGPRGPQKWNIHAWVLRVKHLAYAYPPSTSGTASSRRPVCIFTDGYFVIDSNDGANVVNSF